MNNDYYSNDSVIIDVNDSVAAVLTYESASKVFDYECVQELAIKKSKRGIVPWGPDNLLPKDVLEKIRKDETMSSNLQFNILTGYGAGFTYSMDNGEKIPDDIKRFFRRNNPVNYHLEQQTDFKTFYLAVATVIVDREGKRITRLLHQDITNCRFEVCNKKGFIENVFITNWEDDPSGRDAQKVPVLRYDDPITDLLVRFGREEDPISGKILPETKDRIFAIVMRMPMPGFKYYSFPPYWANFQSGWYDIKAMIPLGKKAKMTNGMQIKYIVRFHQDYFSRLFKSESITDPAKQKVRKALEISNIKSFLSGIENSGKMWLSGFYTDPTGKEVDMVKIEVLDSKKEGGDWIEDAEESANIQCYAMGVHPSLIGSSPGKSKNINGTEARELFTMKQAMERAPRDILSLPIEIVKEFNGWENLVYDIPDLMLTTLDQGSDASIATSKPQNDDTNE